MQTLLEEWIAVRAAETEITVSQEVIFNSSFPSRQYLYHYSLHTF